MDEAFVCNPAGEAFRNVSLPLHFTVENSYRFPVVRLVDVKNVFFPGTERQVVEHETL